MRVIPLLFVLPSLLHTQPVRTGAEILIENHLDILRGKTIGVVCNHTSFLPNRTHLVDTLLKRGIEITALFSPEHGIRGNIPAGVSVPDTFDAKTGLRVYSLYGSRRHPPTDILRSVDMVLLDLQDVGARFFTYYLTMSLIMEAAAELGKPLIILDRPNPINGIDIEGPLLDSAVQSGVGRFPLPIRHAMTMGELAQMIRGEGWIPNAASLNLTVIPMRGWRREMWFDDTDLPWTPPSPNMKFLSTAIVYPGTCLFEATNLSEGRGTLKPFEYLGSPWLQNDTLARALNNLKLPGVRFHPVVFTPKADSIRAPHPKYENEQCRGIYIQVIDRTSFQPVVTALNIFEVVRALHPHRFTINTQFFNRLLGTNQFVNIPSLRDSLITVWIQKISDFRGIRQNYLLY